MPSRETDWIFSSEPGRRELAESAGFDRLVLVTLHRGHTYHGLDKVKEEVSAKALELAQDSLPEGRKVTLTHVFTRSCTLFCICRHVILLSL